MTGADSDELPMEQVGHFRILEKIGEGGMGEVYRARDDKLRREVAIKVVAATRFPNETARAQLLREARSAAGLNHSNICVVYEVGEAARVAYIAMEYVAGESVAARIARAPLSTAEVVRLGIQLADALAHAHQKGVIHRDLKPQNIIVTPEGRLKVLDFGLAKRLFEPHESEDQSTDVLVNSAGVIRGTPAYMAPEQLRGRHADERSDIWAMGVILHEMISRRRPFEGKTWPEISASILSFPPAPLPAGSPIELSAIVSRCLEKEPENRYQTAAEVRSSLEVMRSTVVSRPIASPQATRRRAAIASALVLVVAAFFAMERTRDRGRPASRTTAAVTATSPNLAETTLIPVAVMPFSTTMGPDGEYLGDGVQDAVIGELARLKELLVLSRTSTVSFRQTSRSRTEIARALHTDTFVEGAVSRSGNRVRVDVRLFSVVPVEHQLWAGSFERDMRDILSLYGEIGSAIAAQIDASRALQTAGVRRGTAPPLNPEIYTLYLRGMYQLHHGGEEGFRAALALMKQAIELDPADPLPYAGLAQAYELRIHDGLATPEDIDFARAALQKAERTPLALPELSGARAMIAQYSDWDWPTAKANFETALALNPSLAEIRRHYGWYLVAEGHPEDGVAQIRRGKDTEPLDGRFYADIAWILAGLGRATEGLSDARKALSLAPENPYVLESAGFSLAQNGLYDDAMKALRKATAVDPAAKWLIAQTSIASGHSSSAQPIIDDLKNDGTADAAYGLAQIYAALGNKDEAIHWAAIATQKHAIYAPWMGADAGLIAIRDDPRFRKILASMKLPVEAR